MSRSGALLEDSEVEATLHALVSAQILYWEGRNIPYGNFLEALDQLNDLRDDLFIFQFTKGNVEIASKKKHYTLDQIQTDFNEHTKRANVYKKFFKEVAERYCPDLVCSFGMPMHDGAVSGWDIPLCAFQKPSMSRALLLPDVDALNNDFYEKKFDDPVPYSDKRESAIFVGATTGSRHTLASVAKLTNERLKLGTFFRDNPDVDFRLPLIVQCDSEETKQAIRDLGFGTGWADWNEQLEHKFLISVDGNGATCSRVAIALKSNSVLLKFESDHLLHYFGALISYKHYIPLGDEHYIQPIIDAERRNPNLCLSIAKDGRTFYENYLTRAPCMRYVAMLFDRYAKSFNRQSSRPESNSQVSDVTIGTNPSEPKSGAISGVCLGHISDKGDVASDINCWVGEVGSGRAIEGFSIDLFDITSNLNLEYQAFYGLNEAPLRGHGGTFVGTRSLSKPIYGMAVTLLGESARAFDCSYRVSFLDGSISGICPNGSVCRSGGGAAVEAFQIVITTK